MRGRLLAGLVALGLAGCIGVQRPSQVVTYGAAAMAPKADADGWYTFGQTRYKGALLDGAPDGTGSCIDADSYSRTVTPCTFSKGVRVDTAYLAARQREIDNKRRNEEREREEREVWEAKRAREREQSRREADAMLARDLAKMQTRMSDDMARISAASRGTTVELERAKAQQRVEFEARMAEEKANPDSELNQSKRRDAQREQSRREADEKADALRKKQEADRKNVRLARAQKNEAEANELKRNQEKELAAAAKKEADDKALAEKQERERARLEAERVAREEARKREQERIAAAAAEKAAKEAKLQAERQARSDYLQELTQRIKLRARTCFGPKYYVVGSRPKISPTVVDCVDVHYRARCEGSSGYTDGVVKNFIGISTDCYMGDVGEMSPTPSCPVEKVRLEVLSVSGCGR